MYTKKKKVYCWHCMWYIPPSKGNLDQFTIIATEEKCVNPIAFSTKKVKGTYRKPGYDQPITISPEVLNKNNNCKGFTEGIHPSRIKPKPKKKPWWKLW